ncbi:unnamed protein product [Prorocentrum cordatum]|uniref:Uncharacterized protein n=1 Tax=Prorocentrum cordatum TaxID=2364126 RepID=A0ABN9VPJ9_9DINO|nr:unnamed protein product [Polarella glacialis]
MHAPRPPGPIVDLTRERWIYYRFRRPGERPAWPTRSSGRMAQPPSPRTAPSSEEGLRGAFSSPYSSIPSQTHLPLASPCEPWPSLLPPVLLCSAAFAERALCRRPPGSTETGTAEP